MVGIAGFVGGKYRFGLCQKEDFLLGLCGRNCTWFLVTDLERGIRVEEFWSGNICRNYDDCDCCDFERIGIGDGVVLLLMGTWAGGVLTITCCVTAVFLAGMVGVYLIVVKKKSGKETIPFVPFLLISYLINTTQGILEVIQ